MKRKSGVYVIYTCIVSLSLTLALTTYGKTGPDVSLGVRLDNAHIQTGMRGERYLEILLTAPETDRFQNHTISPPLNIALVIDTSGSMRDAGKMEYVKKAARHIVNRLRYTDRISLVAYDSRARVILPMQDVENRSSLIRKIDSLHPGGGTNLGAGLQEGYRQIGYRRSPHTINRVILLSDGLANTGITSSYELAGIAAGYYREGVSLSTLGVGRNFNEDLMATMAMDGGGMYYYIDDPFRIPEILAREFSTIERLVASNIILRIDFLNSIGVSKVMGNRYEKSGKTVVYDVGELSLGERRRYMVLLTIPDLPRGRHSIGTVQVEYRAAGSRKSRLVSKTFFLHSDPGANTVNSGWNREVVERAYIFELSEARKKAAEAVDRGDSVKAQQLLSAAGKKLEHVQSKSERLVREQKSIEEYAVSLKKNPRGEEFRRTQKRAKYKSYALEGE